MKEAVLWNLDTVLNVWDYADIKEFPSTNEQRAFANKWYKSLEEKNG